jgi:hypothetical protein
MRAFTQPVASHRAHPPAQQPRASGRRLATHAAGSFEAVCAVLRVCGSCARFVPRAQPPRVRGPAHGPGRSPRRSPAAASPVPARSRANRRSPPGAELCLGAGTRLRRCIWCSPTPHGELAAPGPAHGAQRVGAPVSGGGRASRGGCSSFSVDEMLEDITLHAGACASAACIRCSVRPKHRKHGSLNERDAACSLSASVRRSRVRGLPRREGSGQRQRGSNGAAVSTQAHVVCAHALWDC